MGISAHPLNALSHPPPPALLETVRVAPRTILFDEGHLFRPIAVPGEHGGRQRINLGTRDEPRPDAALPKLPEECAPNWGQGSPYREPLEDRSQLHQTTRNVPINQNILYID